jgi:hypothetical protein
MRLAELDTLLAILEDEKKICRTELRPTKGGLKYMIRLIQ